MFTKRIPKMILEHSYSVEGVWCRRVIGLARHPLGSRLNGRRQEGPSKRQEGPSKGKSRRVSTRRIVIVKILLCLKPKVKCASINFPSTG